ncbi:Cna B-type domain-containing protein [Ihubacter sp. rT4E-8]|uniref:Cna B-type domain-containing protein n=1 Tax=unclassified Ihubacter TaxID=2633299 RepID=UPI003C7A815B
MKEFKKAASLFLSLLIVVGLMPLSVFADNSTEAEPNGSAAQIGNYFEADDVSGRLSSENNLQPGDTQQTYADGQIKVNKTIRPTDRENVFDVDLEVVTKDKIERKEISEDAAVVLVIDTSGSMNDQIGGLFSQTRLTQAKKAAQTFINGFTSENGQRKVAIVSFSKNAEMKQGWTDADDLKRTGNWQCQAISSLEADGGTNMEAGLQNAKSLLNSPEVSEIANKNIILLTDGKPTYYDAGKGPGSATSHSCHANVEALMKNDFSNVNKYAVYIGREDDKIKCEEWGTWNKRKYEVIENSCSLEKSIPSWLRSCGFTCFTTNDADKLVATFKKISQLIELQAKAYILTDPMGEYIKLADSSLAENDGVSVTEDGFTWDLKQVLPDETSKQENGAASYTYRLSYRVKLNNLKAGFEMDKYYPVNGVTSLTYLIEEKGKETETELETAYFNVPSVKGYTGDLEFTKVDDSGKSLTGVEFTLTADDNGSFSMTAVSDASGKISFSGIPSGHEYTLEETKVPTGYHKSADKKIGVEFGKVNADIVDGKIVNHARSIDVTVHKIWDDNSDQDGKRPESIQVQLYANGEKYGQPVTMSSPETPKQEQKLNEAEVNEPQEIPADNITPEVNEQPEEAVKSDQQDESNIDTDAEQWQPEDETADQNQISNSENTDKNEGTDLENTPEAVPSVNEWTYTWSGLPEYSGGQKIVYTIAEVDAGEGYVTSEITRSETEGMLSFRITNSCQTETVKWNVTKIWNDNDNQDGKRPDSIQVQLFADGVSYGEPVALREAENWTYTWDHLPAFKDGSKISYTVDEVSVPADYEKTVVTPTTITNVHTPETIIIPISKVWNDDNDKDKLRPVSIGIRIKNGDQIVQTVTLTAENHWSLNVTLPKYVAGEKAVYTVDEPNVPEGYTSSVNGYVITNTHTPQITPPGPITPEPDIPIIDPDVPLGPGPDNPDNPDTPDNPIIDDPDVPLAPLPELPENEYMETDGKPTDPKQPRTGDETPLLALTGILLASAGTLGTILIRRKEKTEK